MHGSLFGPRLSRVSVTRYSLGWAYHTDDIVYFACSRDFADAFDRAVTRQALHTYNVVAMDRPNFKPYCWFRDECNILLSTQGVARSLWYKAHHEYRNSKRKKSCRVNVSIREFFALAERLDR